MRKKIEEKKKDGWRRRLETRCRCCVKWTRQCWLRIGVGNSHFLFVSVVLSPRLYRALQVVVFKTNLVCFFVYFLRFFFLFRSTSPFRISDYDDSRAETPFQSIHRLLCCCCLLACRLFLFIFGVSFFIVFVWLRVFVFWLSTSLDDTWHTPDNMDDSGKRLGTRQVILILFTIVSMYTLILFYWEGLNA